jgi:hypothetical protein
MTHQQPDMDDAKGETIRSDDLRQTGRRTSVIVDRAGDFADRERLQGHE